MKRVLVVDDADFMRYAIKTIIMSAMGQEIMVREAIAFGAKSFIVKPFKEEQVIKTLNKILSLNKISERGYS